MIDNRILTDAQYGFRRDLGTMEQCINLHLLLSKCTLVKKGHIYLCFADLSSAFNLVNHTKLWQTLVKMGSPTEIDQFLPQLYAQLTSRVRYGSRREVTPWFKITRAVQHGCVLVPLLFSLFINRVDEFLQKINTDTPKVDHRLTPVLLYADDAVLISRTGNGLQHVIEGFTAYMEDKNMKINLKKHIP